MLKKKLLEIHRKIFRAIKIWILVIKLLFILWLDSKAWSYLGGSSTKNKKLRQSKRARWLTSELLDLGAAFIKIGQLLSARPDVLPAEWVIELAKLQDNVPPFSLVLQML